MLIVCLQLLWQPLLATLAPCGQLDQLAVGLSLPRGQGFHALQIFSCKCTCIQIECAESLSFHKNDWDL